MGPVLELSGVGLRFGSGPERLCDAALTVMPGAVVTIAGPAGSGKTLLAELSALARRASRGSVRLFGQEIAGLPSAELARLRRRIGHVDMAEPQIASLTPVENVALPLRLAGIGAPEAEARAAEMLNWLARGASVHDPAVSGRIALARAAAAKPELMLVDEPGALFLPDRQKLFHLVDQLRRQGVGFLLLSRDPDMLAGLSADHRFSLVDGRLHSDGRSR